METSLKTGFAQIFSCCPKKLSCPKFGGAAAPLAPPARTPMRNRWSTFTISKIIYCMILYTQYKHVLVVFFAAARAEVTKVRAMPFWLFMISGQGPRWERGWGAAPHFLKKKGIFDGKRIFDWRTSSKYPKFMIGPFRSYITRWAQERMRYLILSW